jgi:hypothetical protein
MTREDRAHELQSLKATNPRRIIALYRAITGKDELGQLPEGVGFTAMIDAIIEHEVAGGVIDGGRAESDE